MKKVLKNVSFVILLLKMCIVFGQETSAQKRIVIDVGHGGKDSGAIGINGIQEKDVVMNIANAILTLNDELDTPWILRFVLCHPFRSYSARHFGLICATFRLRPDPFRFVLCQ